MARPAPAVERTVATLNFLAAHPDEPFTLSELSRRLDITKATAHTMLNAIASSRSFRFDSCARILQQTDADF